MVATHGGHNELHLRVLEHGVQIGRSMLGRVGDEAVLVEGVGANLHTKAESREVAGGLLHAMGKEAAAAPGGADDTHGVVRPQWGRLDR